MVIRLLPPSLRLILHSLHMNQNRLADLMDLSGARSPQSKLKTIFLVFSPRSFALPQANLSASQSDSLDPWLELLKK